MNAKEPDQLLFWQLPEACGMEPFDTKIAEAGRSKEFLTHFGSQLRSCSAHAKTCSVIFKNFFSVHST